MPMHAYICISFFENLFTYIQNFKFIGAIVSEFSVEAAADEEEKHVFLYFVVTFSTLMSLDDSETESENCNNARHPYIHSTTVLCDFVLMVKKLQRLSQHHIQKHIMIII